MSQTREEHNKQVRDARAARHHNRYQSLKAQYLDAFRRARKQMWTFQQLLEHKDSILGSPAYQRLPQWVKYQLVGVWDALFDSLWAELADGYVHPENPMRILPMRGFLESPLVSLVKSEDFRKCWVGEGGRLIPFC